MSRSSLQLLFDIDQNVELVLDLTKARKFQHYQHDISFRYAVLFAVLVVTDAVGKLPPELTNRYPDILWGQLVAVGERLYLEQDSMDREVIWQMVTELFPPLHKTVKLMMGGGQPR